MHDRPFAQWLWKIQPEPEIIFGPNDIVISFRTPRREGGFDKKYDIYEPTSAYFEACIDHAVKKMGGRGKIYLMTTCGPSLCNETANLINNFGAIWNPSFPADSKYYNAAKIYNQYQGTVINIATDIWLGMTVPGAFIGSYGTFSWIMAYAGLASNIYLPFDRKNPSPWMPGCELFIHDDPRVWYGEILNPSNIRNAIDFYKTPQDKVWQDCFDSRKPIPIEY